MKKIQMPLGDVELLTKLVDPALLTSSAGLVWDGETVTADGELGAAVSEIVADPDWRVSAEKLGLRKYAAVARYNKEIGGVLIGGMRYPTDRETQAKLTGAFALAQVSPDISIDWKLENGSFVSLSASQMQDIAAEVGAFVQRCFSAEAVAVAYIDNGSIVNVGQVDACFAVI